MAAGAFVLSLAFSAGCGSDAPRAEDFAKRQCALQDTFDPARSLPEQFERINEGIRKLRDEAYEEGIDYDTEVIARVEERCPAAERRRPPGVR